MVLACFLFLNPDNEVNNHKKKLDNKQEFSKELDQKKTKKEQLPSCIDKQRELVLYLSDFSFGNCIEPKTENKNKHEERLKRRQSSFNIPKNRYGIMELAISTQQTQCRIPQPLGVNPCFGKDDHLSQCFEYLWGFYLTLGLVPNPWADATGDSIRIALLDRGGVKPVKESQEYELNFMFDKESISKYTISKNLNPEGELIIISSDDNNNCIIGAEIKIPVQIGSSN